MTIQPSFLLSAPEESNQSYSTARKTEHAETQRVASKTILSLKILVCTQGARVTPLFFPLLITSDILVEHTVCFSLGVSEAAVPAERNLCVTEVHECTGLEASLKQVMLVL